MKAVTVASFLLLFQFLRGKMLYIHEMNNYLELALYSSTLIFFVPVWSEKSSKQWHAGAIGIFLAWIRFIWFLKFFPTYGIYIIMAKRVFFTVLKVSRYKGIRNASDRV
jgi:transient receptor potential cation channel subfamily A protein 1